MCIENLESAENSSYAYQKYKTLRNEMGLTDYRVAQMSNGRILQCSLSAWKRGEYNLKFETLNILAEVLGVPIATFLEIQEG